MKERGVLTIATGKKMYVDMACNLARSFLMWRTKNNIIFQLVTDLPDLIDLDIRNSIEIIPVRKDELKPGFISKLTANIYSKTYFTLFIDSDCLVYGDLNDVFDIFSGNDFSVVGHNIYQGTHIGFCTDVESVMKRMKIDYFPLLCGSVYYFEKTSICEKIFLMANSLIESYDEIGLTRLRNRENEEPLIAISMSFYQQLPVADDGHIKADRMFYKHLNCNILKGKAVLWSDIPQVKEYNTNIYSKPKIVHYNGNYNNDFEYRSEVMRLKLYSHGLNTILNNIIVSSLIVIPSVIKDNIIFKLRPLYRLFFGFRKIKTSERIIP